MKPRTSCLLAAVGSAVGVGLIYLTAWLFEALAPEPGIQTHIASALVIAMFLVAITIMLLSSLPAICHYVGFPLIEYFRTGSMPARTRSGEESGHGVTDESDDRQLKRE